jgi:hypothetical protein
MDFILNFPPTIIDISFVFHLFHLKDTLTRFF